MDGGWGMNEEFFEESINVGDKCVNDISKKESDSVCSDCSLASHQLGQVSDGAVNPTHPIIELYRAYGLHKS